MKLEIILIDDNLIKFNCSMLNIQIEKKIPAVIIIKDKYWLLFMKNK